MKIICVAARSSSMAAFLMALAIVFLCVGTTAAQTATAWGYSTGYGNVYGSFGLASTMQSMYNVARAQALRRSETASRPMSSGRSSVRSTAPPAAQPRVIRNYGVFVPDPTIDTGKAFAAALGETPEERQLIKSIYAATKTEFEKEAAARGWRNNMAAGLTFFIATAVTIYRDSEEPNDASIRSCYELLNATFDEIPEFKNVSNRDKQNFNNMAVGFAGLLLSGYIEGKQTNNAETVASYQKLAGVLIQMVLKTDPENLRIENGQIIMK